MLEGVIRRGRRWVGAKLQEDNMRRLGIQTTTRLGILHNSLIWGDAQARYRRLYERGFDALLRANGAPVGPIREMVDGVHLDTTRTLPHLDRVLAEADELIAERALGRHVPPGTYRAFFQDLIQPGDLERFPAFLDFILSSDVIATAAHHLRSVPILSTTLPPGVRFIESYAGYEPGSIGKYKDSQLFHMDFYSRVNVYVILVLRDITPDMGPFRWLPRSTSQRVARRLRYWTKGVRYRMPDEAIYAHVDPAEVETLACPRGTVLFIDPSACLHYGSRDCVKPRYMLMYGFTRPCRTDWSEHFLEPKRYAARPGDPRLRRLVLRRGGA